MPALIGLILDVTPLTPSELRWELAGVAIGFILLWVGFAATAVFLFRRSSDLTLVYFGSASILYALRMLFGERMIRRQSASHLADGLLAELRRWSSAERDHAQSDDIT